jgi:hypothetical protein
MNPVLYRNVTELKQFMCFSTKSCTLIDTNHSVNTNTVKIKHPMFSEGQPNKIKAMHEYI